MREVKPGNGSGWAWPLGIVVGIGVFIGVASIVPGAGCADGWLSTAIGHQGACSHHGGVTSGWTFLGLPAGLLAGVGVVALVESLATRRSARNEKAVIRQWEEKGSSATRTSAASLVRRPGEDLQAYVRSVIAAGQWIAFKYPGEDATDPRERTVRPRWIQMADEANEHTLCLVGDCSVEGQRKFALALMDQVRAAEPASVQ